MKSGDEDSGKWLREAIESIAIAIMLAFLFRAFEAEAFVIPTGSMAPTLQGRHKDIDCPQCGYHYQAGASEVAELGRDGPVVTTTCPMCRYSLRLDVRPQGGRWVVANRDHVSFTGDRILVNKFSYQLNDPERWDVIVFKYPGNAKQNYIKRLIGLPGEEVRIFHGDIYTRPLDDPEAPFVIATKPPHKLVAMLQPVHDTNYLPEALVEGGWPSSWEHFSGGPAQWESDDGGRTFHIAAEGEQASWLRYRHRPPSPEDWQAIAMGQPPPQANRPGELISDFYAYNAFTQARAAFPNMGMHWVGDLAVECNLEVESGEGKIALDLVEAGRHHTCTINLADGTATISVNDGSYPLGVALRQEYEELPPEERKTEVSAATSVKGPGSYELRFANVDDVLTLWVDGEVVLSTEYPPAPPEQDSPRWSQEDPGDLLPVGLGVQGASVRVDRLRVLRDVYYIATTRDGAQMDYSSSIPPPTGSGGSMDSDYLKVRYTFSHPEIWAASPLWNLRQAERIGVEHDEFFPMGDNCPQSQDGRFWYPHPRGNHPDFFWPEGYAPHVVPRELLTGKAFVIYWPHPLHIPLPGGGSLPIVPNVGRMGLIR